MTTLQHLIENTLIAMERDETDILGCISNDVNFINCPLTEQEVLDICSYVMYTYNQWR